MNTDTFQRERAVAIDAVREAARLCQAVRRELDPSALEKEDRSPVTVADFGSQALICRALHEAFPEDPIIAEEDSSALRAPENEELMKQVVRHVRTYRRNANTGAVCAWIDRGDARVYSDRFWTLDPIDGTKGFLRGDQYAIALALVVEGEVQVAALACPNFDQIDGTSARGGGLILSAVRGHGTSSLRTRGNNGSVRVRASATREPSQARFCESFVSAHSSHEDAVTVAERLGITREPVRIDSQAKYALVARGGADIYLRLPKGDGYVEKIWDHAAGLLAVTEAGGTVTDVEGRPLDFRHGRRLEKNRGVVATNGHLHEEVLDALAAVGV